MVEIGTILNVILYDDTKCLLCRYLHIKFMKMCEGCYSLLFRCSNVTFFYRSKVFLVLNGETVPHVEKVNSTTMMYHLVNVQKPLSIVHCKLQSDSWNDIVGGLDLQGGRMYS